MNFEEKPVLSVDQLTVAYQHDDEWLPAVRDFSVTLHAGETVALVGESGSGKSTVALAIMRYLGESGRIVSGSIYFDDLNLLTLSKDQLRNVWGKQIAFVPQDPLSSLNPSMRIGEQIAEILRRHEQLSRSQADARAEHLLVQVRVPDPARVMRSYPHQISGGMQQRVLIAMAISTGPRLLILDEPTTGLDVTTQAAVLDLLRELSRDMRAAVLYVTHNLGVVANLSDRVIVLYAGELVESAAVARLFGKSLHPYSGGLLDSVPQLGQTKTHVNLRAIPGQIPPLGERSAACVFAPRCTFALDLCHQERPDLELADDGHVVRCHRWLEVAAGTLPTRAEPTDLVLPAGSHQDSALLLIEDLQVYYPLDHSLGEALRRRPAPVVKAVDGIDLSLAKGQTLGIVGESGSGKTSLARAVIGLVERTGGDIRLLDVELPADLSHRPLQTLRQLQYIFQNPEEALNPYLTVGETLRRPYRNLLGLSNAEAGERVVDLLAAVNLPSTYADRYPTQLSGGEKQRVAIARAFASSPELLIGDEPVSALDVSVQASILNLLRDLQRDNENSLVFISHDLAVVGYLADHIAVMYLGKIMELAPAPALFTVPMHPYTEALIAAIPSIERGSTQVLATLEGDVPSQVDTPQGCPFHTRCPRFFDDICRTQPPPCRETAAGDRIYCHIPLAELAQIQTVAKLPRSPKDTHL